MLKLLKAINPLRILNNFVTRLNIRTNLIVLTLIVLISLTFSTYMGIYTLNQVKIGSSLYEEILDLKSSLEIVALLQSDLNQIRGDSLAMLGEENPDIKNQINENILELSGEIDFRFNEILQIIDDEEMKLPILDAQQTWSEFINSLNNEIIPAINKGNASTARELTSGIQKLRYERFLVQVESLVDTYTLTIEELEVITKDVVRSKIITVIAISVVMFAIVLFIAVMISSAIIIPLKKTAGYLERISDGDLSQQLEKTSDNEIGLLFSSANTMSEKLQHLISNIRETSLEIQTTAITLNKSSVKLSGGTKHQNEMIDNVASAFTQMAQITSEINSKTKDLNASLQDSSSSLYELTASIKEISGFADKAFQEVDKITSSHLEINSTMGNTLGFLDKLALTSQQASTRASDLTTAITETGERATESEKLTNEVSIMAKDNGVKALERMINVSRKNKDLVDDYSKIIKSLGSKSANIGKILDVIYNVVDQSSLLSLNAAIIAAQAGEHGKSFAVVADEVRKLSNTTTVNLKQIEEVVQGVRSEVEEAVNMIDGITNGMDSSILAAEQANNILKMIEDISTQSTVMAGEITASVKKQVDYCNDIHESVLNNSKQVDQIKEVMNEQKKGSDLIVSSVEEIRTIAEQLKNSTLEQSNGSAIISQTTSETQSFSEKLVRAIDGQQDANKHTVESLEEISNTTLKNLGTLKEIDSISKKLGSLEQKLISNISKFKLPK